MPKERDEKEAQLLGATRDVLSTDYHLHRFLYHSTSTQIAV